MRIFYYYRLLLCLFFTLSFYATMAQVTLIPLGSTWKYWANTEANAPGAAWTGSGVFDDSGWPSGVGRFGYGGDGEVTCVPAGVTCATGCLPGGTCSKYMTTYFRKSFAIANVSLFSGFYLNMTRDDGAVVYVNGSEVWRSNMPAGAVVYTTPASTNVSAPDETAIFISPLILSSFFLDGNNVIAVELHQNNLSSTDLGFDLQLTGQVNSNATLVPFGSAWKYWADTEANAPLPEWNGSGFYDDLGWPSGPARLGYGGDGEVTCVPAGAACPAGCAPGGACTKYMTTYFRRSFNISDINNYSGFIINLKRDDGAVIYVNGAEVWRSNMPAGAVTYTTAAVTNVLAPDETATFSSPLIPVSNFLNGENIIAVELHQNNLSSSDLGFDLELQAQVNSSFTLIQFGEDWLYHANTQANAPGATWVTAGFNDSGWPDAPSKLGFGGDGEVTCIPAGAAGCTPGCLPGGTCTKYTTTYFRKKFNITNLSNFSGFKINLVRDDGAVVYVNGVEVWRTNMPAGAVAYNTFAVAVVGDVDENAVFSSPIIPNSAFLEGENQIAVELHQVNATSSDLGFNLELVGNYNVLNYGGVWKYHADLSANQPGPTWNTPAFADGAWPSGTGKLGFGDDGENICIPAGTGCDPNPCLPGNVCQKFITTYFRKKIIIPDVSVYTGFRLNMIRDDGAVVYVNGIEVWRTNMPAGAISYGTFASVIVNEGTDENLVHSSPVISASNFVSGENTIAVEVHQINNISSDLGFDMEIIGINPVSPNEVIYLWSGALLPTSAKVNAKMSVASTQVRLAVSTSSDISSPVFGNYATASTSNNLMAALSITGLTPGTKYYYAVEADGVLDASAGDVGSFTTPVSGPASFRYVLGSCGVSATHPVFTKMQEKDPLMVMIIGDFHYTNPNSGTDINVHRSPYETNILSPTPTRNLFLNYPLAYVWDDHDYSGNDSDSTAAGKTNARLAYREYVPHYNFGAGIVADRPIYQAFTIGRVHFILTDLRSSRGGVTMMGVAQKAWFKNQCLFARDNNLIIGWVSSVSFAGNQVDNWGGFAAERTELGNFFRDNNIKNMFIMSGDAHMSAIDNGNNHDFATGTPNPERYPVIAAAALNQNGSYKGGVYSEAGIVIPPNGPNNSYPNPDNTFGQYGVVDVSDLGDDEICIGFTIYRVTNGGVESELVSYNFCRDMLIVVPVKIKSFDVKAISDKKGSLLNWIMETEANCKKYIIERSSNGHDFSPIGETSCHGGSSSYTYSYTDLNVLKGRNYYRINAIDQNDRSHYSEIRSIVFEQSSSISIYPNPARQTVGLFINNLNAAAKAKYIIYNSALEEQLSGNLYLQAGMNNYAIPVDNLSKGFYMIRVVTPEGILTEKFIIE